MDNQIEIWKPVVGYEGRYEVSSFGRVKSLAGKVYGNKIQPEKIIKPAIDGGYLRISIGTHLTRRSIYVARMVAIAFIPNPHNKKEVNHIDGNKFNNRLENLEWTTRSENQKHAFATGLQSNKGEKHPCRKLNNKTVLEIRSKYKFREYTQKQLGEEYGVGEFAIFNVINRKTWNNI